MFNIGLHSNPGDNLSLGLSLSPLSREVSLNQDTVIPLSGAGHIRLGEQLFNPVIGHNDWPGSELSLLLHCGPLLAYIFDELFHILRCQSDQDGPKEGPLCALTIGIPVRGYVIWELREHRRLRPDLVDRQLR